MADADHNAAGEGAAVNHEAGASEREQRLANAMADFADLLAREETADVEAFCEAHPDLQPELREALGALLQLDHLAESGEIPRAEEKAAPLPERLSGHKILGEIGSGGMGRVLLAEDERLGRKVAIKILSPRYQNNEALRARFMQEARAMARLSHPNIVHIYNLGQPDEQPHFVMEYLEGAALTEAAKALTLTQKVEMMQKVVEAVEFLHHHGVIHRDLKPGNILVGTDLEPKLLDFGLALHMGPDGKRLTNAGEIMGTPNYFSPEQARGDAPLDARSDVFSLGTLFYELLTGVVPFRGGNFPEHRKQICEQDPKLPRRLNPAIPGDLQNICLKALEKNPAERYATAREMAADLERFLAGEPVLAAPTAYSRLMAGKIEQHVRELDGWRRDQILSEPEFDGLRKRYERLIEREDAWIMEVRRLTLPQVSLYLGAWILVVGAALIFLFYYAALKGPFAVLIVAAAAAPTGYSGIRAWKEGHVRISVAYLLAFCLLLPITLLVAMWEFHLFAGLTKNDPDLELFYQFESFKDTTNAQLWWAIFLSLPAYVWLRRFTKSSVYSLVFAVMLALLWMTTLLRMGAIDWLQQDRYVGYFFLELIPVALTFLYGGNLLERQGYPNDSRYFYPLGVFFSYAALSGVAGLHKPYMEWLERVAPWTRGQLEYLFILNAGIYLALHWVCERFHTAQMRGVAKAFRFVVPGHVMTSLLLLGLAATDRWQNSTENVALLREARIFEVLLPVVACVFIFGSIPKQMKNYLATGMLFLAIGIVRLQQNWLKDRSEWPSLLLLVGILLMIWASRYPAFRVVFVRWLRRKARRTRPPGD